MILFKKLSYKLKRLFSGVSLLRVNFSSFLWVMFMLLVLTALSVNIYTTYSKGMDTMQKFQEEKQKLEDLKAENERLQNEVEHYESIEYKKIYARDNLNLGEKGELLYYVDRPEEVLEIEGLAEPEVKITLEDNISYWRKLILGL